MVMNSVHFSLLFRTHLIALVIQYNYLQNFLGMEYYISRLSRSFDILRVELMVPI